ncbi:hypothetical protein ACFR9U_05605 [Halorientalis brevis]|uniref:Uncharacterized protein n=1 Tax=Halorientalis brevis TaxID=1126241 RepID=A0ABD6CAL9_9EURY|nr:hypothetical protein [Halorientalis brevis]
MLRELITLLNGGQPPRPDEIPDLSGRALAVAAVLGLVLLLVGVVLFLPVVQSLGYLAVVATPSLVWWTGIGLLVLVVGVAVGGARATTAGVTLGLGIVVVMGLFVGPVVGGIYAHEHTADAMQANVQTVDTLPNSSKAHTRVLPRQVGDKYAQSSMQFPQYRTTESDITYTNDTYTWSYGLAPDNPMVAWLGTQHGAVYVDMEQSEKRVSVRETEFTHGVGQVFTDSFGYRTNLDRLDVNHQPDTRFVFEQDGEAYLAQSYVTHEWQFKLFPLPQLYAVPHFGGVQVVDQDGSIRDIPAKKVASVDLLNGQSVYPYSLVRYKVNSMKYKQGALNKWFWKEGVLEMADLPADGNDWPVTVPTESDDSPELTHYVATEPTGSGSGVYEVWTFDGQTGAAAIKRYDDAQIGPQKATKFIRQHKDVARLNNVEAVEPVPVVRGDTLYWQVKVIPDSSNGLTYTGFVNANSGKTILVSKTNKVRAFVTGSDVNITDRNETDSGGSGTSVRLVVTDGEGTVVRRSNVTVPVNGSVNINVSNSGEKTVRPNG